MNPVSLGLDGLLTLLLLAALAVGWRLNGKLKSLRESQAGFVKAVAALDLAAGRAEAGLAALRQATEEAHDALLTRIETARTLAARLDRACEDAGTAAAKTEAMIRRAERVPPPAPASVATRPTLVSPLAPAEPGGEINTVLRLIESAREEAAERSGQGIGALRPSAAPAPAPAPPASDVASDRLSRFVARRREARAG